MTIEEAILEKLRKLSPDRQQEVLDFAEFLSQKYRTTGQTSSSSATIASIGKAIAAGALINEEKLGNSEPMAHAAFTAAGDTFTAYVEYDPETRLYVGIIPGVVGAHTQAENLDELQVNLREVLEICLEEYGEDLDNLPRFVGIQTIEVGS